MVVFFMSCHGLFGLFAKHRGRVNVR